MSSPSPSPSPSPLTKSTQRLDSLGLYDSRKKLWEGSEGRVSVFRESVQGEGFLICRLTKWNERTNVKRKCQNNDLSKAHKISTPHLTIIRSCWRHRRYWFLPEWPAFLVFRVDPGWWRSRDDSGAEFSTTFGCLEGHWTWTEARSWRPTFPAASSPDSHSIRSYQLPTVNSNHYYHLPSDYYYVTASLCVFSSE